MRLIKRLIKIGMVVSLVKKLTGSKDDQDTSR